MIDEYDDSADHGAELAEAMANRLKAGSEDDQGSTQASEAELDLDHYLKLLTRLLAALDIAIDRSEGDTFGIYHNGIMDTMDEAEKLIKANKNS